LAFESWSNRWASYNCRIWKYVNSAAVRAVRPWGSSTPRTRPYTPARSSPPARGVGDVQHTPSEEPFEQRPIPLEVRLESGAGHVASVDIGEDDLRVSPSGSGGDRKGPAVDGAFDKIKGYIDRTLEREDPRRRGVRRVDGLLHPSDAHREVRPVVSLDV
jgi:hypothetical protein